MVLAFTTVACTANPPTPPPPPPSASPAPALLRGLGFAPFRLCQSPILRRFPSAQQMREDVDLIKGMANAVRTYSALDGGVEAAEYAHGRGLRVSVGAWLGPEHTQEQREANLRELDAVIGLAKKLPTVESVIVGNEVLLRKDLTAQRLAEHISYVKRGVGTVPVTTAEIAGIIMSPDNRAVVDAIDYAMVHIYPYWDGVDIKDAAWYSVDVYQRAVKELGKRVVVGETGWPTAGPANGNALPNTANAQRFLNEWKAVAHDQRIDYYYFAAFDEPWKTEGGVGPHWGVYDSSRKPKLDGVDLLAQPGPPPARTTSTATVSGSYYGAFPARVTAGDRASLALYQNWPGAEQYAPSGWMGDLNGIAVDDCASGGRGQTAEDKAIRVDYTPQPQGVGWAGIFWQHPANNWGGFDGGHDLRGMTSLTFFARGVKGGEKVEFFAGGSTQQGAPFSDSLAKRLLKVTLTTQWKQYGLDLRGQDLSRVIGGFGWAASAADNPAGAGFYLDDIQFDRTITTAPRRTCLDLPPGTHPKTIYVMDGNLLCANNSPVRKYEIGLATSGSVSGWLRRESGALRMDYPAGQEWGSAFVTVGDLAAPGSRKGQNLTHCHTLRIDMRSATPGVSVAVGIKDINDPDDGSETKITVTPIGSWKSYSFSLGGFATADRSAVYVLAEFVFGTSTAVQTVFVRNIRYQCG
ncbi:hypothetical protein Rhe02_84090 [Rhizocola hellebori]|uniref:Endo-1,3-beta-glucanase btgC n=2 Tax=Rhizocola hellebori TaxID=1392758 RepID=A0A8J3QIM9_9ACTN|nr:hypothetical protein Rhe02_84090 [Rhizocola hellebori]